jgi:hypothetical protein
VFTPSHNIFDSSTNNYKYTSILSFFMDSFQGINNTIITNNLFVVSNFLDHIETPPME